MTQILVSGATGKLGRIVTQLLVEQGVLVRVLARRPDAARDLFGNSLEIAEGNYDNPATLRTALEGSERAFLLSPISEHLVAHQTAFINAAVAAGVQRIVKVSGSDWTITPDGKSISGDAHAAVERHLAAQPVESVALRPSAWMQVSLPLQITAAREGRPLFSAYGEVPVGFIDARDIAAIAVHQLLATSVELAPLVLTGGEALSINDIATLASQLLHRPVGVTAERPAGQTPPFPPDSFHGRAVAEFMVLIRSGAASGLTDTVARLLGRPPRTVAAFLAEHLQPVAA